MTITKEGALASFYTVNKAPIKHLKVYFSPKQAGEGDPSPENVREIAGYTNLKIIHCGKNLFDSNNKGYYSYNTGVFNNTNSYCYWYIRVKSGDIIRYKGTGPGVGCYFDINGNNFGKIMSSPQTVPENAAFITNNFTNSGTDNIVTINELDLTYEPYHGQTYSLDWSNDIGTIYGGYVDLVTGEVVKQWHMESISNLGITKTSGSGVWEHRYDIRTRWINNTIGYEGAMQNGTICSIFKPGDATANGEFRIYAGILNIYDDTTSSVEEFRTKYGHCQVAYALREVAQTTYQLTPTQLSTLIGRNNIWSNADRVEVEYDLAESNDELHRRRNIMIKGYPDIKSTTTTDVATFTTDTPAPLKKGLIYFSPTQDLHGYSSAWTFRHGSNKWDEDWEVGGIDTTTGENITTEDTIRSKNYCPCSESASYRMIIGTDAENLAYIHYYDSSYNYIGNSEDYVSGVITTPAGAAYYKFQCNTSYGITYNNDISFASPSSTTTYSPHENVCPINGYQSLTVVRAGKNLTQMPVTLVSVYPSGSKFNGASSYKTYAFLVPKGTLYYKTPANGAVSYCGLCDEYPKAGGKIYKGLTMTNRSSSTFDNSDGHKYMYFTITNTSIQDPNIIYDRQLLIYLPGQDSTYETIKNTNISFDWSSDVSYPCGGYIDLAAGTVTITDVVFIITPSTPIYDFSAPTGIRKVVYNLPYTGANRNAIAWSHGWLRERSTAMYNYPGRGGIATGPYNTACTSVEIGLPLEAGNTQQSWLDWLTEQGNVQVWYKLNSPLTIQLQTDKVKTLKGINNIYSDANGNIELSYYSH